MNDERTAWNTDPERSPVHGEDVLGPCGCTDYHMADCPLVTDRLNPPDPPEPDDDDGPDLDEDDD